MIWFKVEFVKEYTFVVRRKNEKFTSKQIIEGYLMKINRHLNFQVKLFHIFIFIVFNWVFFVAMCGAILLLVYLHMPDAQHECLIC